MLSRWWFQTLGISRNTLCGGWRKMVGGSIGRCCGRRRRGELLRTAAQRGREHGDAEEKGARQAARVGDFSRGTGPAA